MRRRAGRLLQARTGRDGHDEPLVHRDAFGVGAATDERHDMVSDGEAAHVLSAASTVLASSRPELSGGLAGGAG